MVGVLYVLVVIRTVLLYGMLGGLLIAALQLVEYRFLVFTQSASIYGGLVALIFAGLGLWLGRQLANRRVQERIRERIVIHEVPVAAPRTDGPFVPDARQLEKLGMTPREHEILVLIAEGLSTREIATRLSVSENTIKTHSSRVFAKLNARRRTQAVQLAKDAGLLP